MKTIHLVFLLLFSFVSNVIASDDGSWIRVNQLGYLPEDIKVAVFLSQNETDDPVFELKDSKTNATVYKGNGIVANAARWGLKKAMRLNFTDIKANGEYYLECNGAKSPSFRINPDVYEGAADFILKYMRQQRCGYNPYLDTLCHQHDGYIVDHPTRSGEKIDVRGGWHDASDYLQYLNTSANATYQMLFAWQQTPDKTIFKDEYDAQGKKGANGIPDILDEARWGLEWLMRMNPKDGVMFNQIADDRDHASYRMPSRDHVDYGWGEGTGRPVYFVTGKPQGLGQHINRTTGVASSAGKFASTFALGEKIFQSIDPDFSAAMGAKALPAYDFAEKYPGNTQTACLKSPYFYEEDNYVDDVELAAATNYFFTDDSKWLKKADYWGQLEEVTPWMELGRARHYQYYPFVNLGHYWLAQSSDKNIQNKYIGFMKKGLKSLAKRASEDDDPFMNGVPFIWCSNNLVTAAVTQARLYNQVSGDESFREMEAALRDWLFGCNPWGTSMICGFPEHGDSPTAPHSSYFELNGDNTLGGLVDGPIYKTIFDNLRGVHLKQDDPYAPFQFGAAVYHDDPSDYSSNEPTMDGTASLSFYLSTMEKAGKIQQQNKVLDAQGATVKLNTDKKQVYLVFSADSLFEGASSVLNALKQEKIKASFFLTGDCLRNKQFSNNIKQIVRDGHYLGAHSDKHLLYAPWNDRQKSLVSIDSLQCDLSANMNELKRFSQKAEGVKYYLPPYEWYNNRHVKTIESLGQEVINFTPGIRTNADYTTPDMTNYMSSQEIIDSLYKFEKENSLNGCIILIHPGTDPARTDKLYNRLSEIIKELKKKGYSFTRF